MRKSWIIVFSALTCITALTGCKAKEETVQSTVPAVETAVAEEETVPQENDSSNHIVVYFSLAGEQYRVGVIEEGNTAIVAKIIAEETGSDVFEIVPENPYPTVHSELLTVAQNEQKNDERPVYVGDVENWDRYDTVYVGYPIWWGDMPMIMYHFLESHDFSSKKIIPFVTHGGSGFANTRSTIATITGADVEDGFAISGETAQNDREATKQLVTEWLHNAD